MAAGIVMLGFFVILGIYHYAMFRRMPQPPAPTTTVPRSRRPGAKWKPGDQSGEDEGSIPGLNRPTRDEHRSTISKRRKRKRNKTKMFPAGPGPAPPHQGRKRKHAWGLDDASYYDDETGITLPVTPPHGKSKRIPQRRTEISTKSPWSTWTVYRQERNKTLWSRRDYEPSFVNRRQYRSEEDYTQDPEHQTPLYYKSQRRGRLETRSWKDWRRSYKKKSTWSVNYPDNDKGIEEKMKTFLF